MNSSLKILFVSSESIPFAKTGGLADVSGSLSKALSGMGHDVRVVMPYYERVKKGGFDLEKVSANVKHWFSGKLFGFDVLENRSGSLKTYFIRNDKYFSRKGLYGTSFREYPDNAVRFSFFSKAVLAAIEAIDFIPDIIHCNDWQTALIPLYLKNDLEGKMPYKDIKTLFTIHNLAYQGVFNRIFRQFIGLPARLFLSEGIEFYGQLNYMKAGIFFADAISTVSRKYAKEILIPEFGCGLEGLLKTRADEISGIPNGVDYSKWSPDTDGFIKKSFSPDDLSGKKECKIDLLDRVGLKFDVNRPVMGYVGRLAHQKGIELIAKIAEKVVGMETALIILGSGEEVYVDMLKKIQEKFSDNVRVVIGFNDELAHKIEAGCDLFMMPSRYEPCGLNQMYSIRYGTIPVVRATGGLDDVIIDVDENPAEGNGFKFTAPDETAFFEAVKRAIVMYNEGDTWKKLMRRAMLCDFSWDRSAKEYVKLYGKILSRCEGRGARDDS